MFEETFIFLLLHTKIYLLAESYEMSESKQKIDLVLIFEGFDINQEIRYTFIVLMTFDVFNFCYVDL